MNVLSFDQATASHLGVDIRREIRTLLWCATLLASVAVALAGPIGFVGLIVPHLLRMLLGTDNRLLVPLSAMYGAAFLLLCDLAGWRLSLLAPASGLPEIPVGVVTALLGGPLFLLLLTREHEAHL
jgi:iron complex transport system permease protein